MSTRTWSRAMEVANTMFYAGHSPREHFRTSLVHADLMASTLIRYLDVVATTSDESELVVVDVGAGDGALGAALLDALDRRPQALPLPVRVIAVDLRPRPDHLDARVEWICGAALEHVPEVASGLVVAHEWLDDLGVELIRRHGDTFTTTVVDDAGVTHAVALSPDDPRVAWTRRWWPDARDVECGVRRDEVWSELVARITHGIALAIDYGHVTGDRPAGPTVAGYSGGRRQPVALDGSVNVTAHVAMDACAEAALASGAGVSGTLMLRQHQALRPAEQRSHAAATSSGGTPTLHQLAERSRWSELVNPEGLGGHWWLVQGVRLGTDALAQLPGGAEQLTLRGSIGV